MPVTVFYGEDDFAISLEVSKLRRSVCHPDWESFNSTQILPSPEALMQAITLVLSSPWGEGGRLVWLQDNRGECTDAQLASLENCLEKLPLNNTLLFTSKTKPEGRLKSTRLLSKYALFKEFPIIPSWQNEQLLQTVKATANQLGLKLTMQAAEALVEAVGNNSRLLHSELQKLSLYIGARIIEVADVLTLVSANTNSSLKLAGFIRKGNAESALSCLKSLIESNEPLPRITATLITQFRTWLWVKLMLLQGESDAAIAREAEINNPKRLYYIKQEVASLSLNRLQQILGQLLDIELLVKTGDTEALFTSLIVNLCLL